MMTVEIVLLSFLVVAAATMCLMKRLISIVIVFAAYSVVMSVVWMLLAAPDLAITEAAVGTGISSVLFFILLKRVKVIEKEYKEEHRRNTDE
ncbi:MAG: DUF4040 domain-containing protein [Oscillospiraceae bacterium]|nr:DUF4040 domain-containing protein [Oscillospiraceae bacterium]